MTIPSTARKAGPLLGTGVQTAWPFTFKVFAAADVAVTIANSAGTETLLVLGADYSVTLNANQDTSPGGTVTYPISGAPLAVGSKLSIVGDIDYDQPLDLPSGGNFSPLALENELDRVVMQIQQLREVSERAVVVPVTSDADGTLPVPEAQKILGWDINGTGLQNYDIPDLFSGAVYADWVADTFAGNGTQTMFVLQRAPGAVGNCDVSVDGQTYVPNADFSLSGATLTFTVAPTAGAEILVRYGSAATQVSSTFSTESQTATAGQTIFFLNNLFYNPGANALAVYVNGLRMVSGVDFLETDIDDVTFTSGLTLGDEVLFISGRTINESIGAEAVSYLPGGTGAVATTAQAKLRESVSVKDFGAVGDGVTDDTAAIQAAITFLQPSGGVLLFPAGTYRVSSSLNWINTANAGKPGIFFQGVGGTGGLYGGATTVIKSYIANGPLFQIQGTANSASGASGSKFANGGGMSSICLDGANATGTSQAIRVNGWQYAEFLDVTIMNFPGDGVTQWTDSGYPNGDYSSSSINFKNCWILNNAGNGINQTGWVGAWNWNFDKTLFAYNGNGAVITSANNAFIDCSWVGNGFSLSGAVLAGGMNIKAGSASGSIGRLIVQRGEFDFCRLKHIELNYIQTALITQTRFNFNDRLSTGTITPLTGIDLASASGSSNVQSILIDQCNFRVDTVGVLTLVKASNLANVQDVSVEGLVLSDNTGGASTITKYEGFTTSNWNLRKGLRAIENGAAIIPGKPDPFYLGRTLTATAVPTATFAVIPFNTQDSVCAQIYPAGTVMSDACFYNTTTGVFTAPRTGFYEIDGFLNIDATTSADTIRCRVVTTTETVEVDYVGYATTASLGTYAIPSTRVFMSGGDTLTVQARSVNNARAMSTTVASRVCIRMVS